MTRIENLRGNLDVAIQQLMQAEPGMKFTDAGTITKKVLRANPLLKPPSLDYQVFQDFVELFCIRSGYLIPREGKLELAGAGFSLTSAQAEKVARRQLRNAGIRLGLDDIDDDQDDSAWRSALAAAVATIDGYADLTPENLAKTLLRTGDVLPVGMSLEDFTAAVADAQRQLVAANVSLSMNARGNETLSDADAERLVDEFMDRRNRSSSNSGARLANNVVGTNEAQRYDALADSLTGKRPQEKRTPPGLAAMIQAMTPAQRERFEKIRAQQGREKNANASAALDTFLDFMEQRVGEGK